MWAKASKPRDITAVILRYVSQFLHCSTLSCAPYCSPKVQTGKIRVCLKTSATQWQTAPPVDTRRTPRPMLPHAKLLTVLCAARAALILAVPVNRTIDDENGDSMTGIKPIYRSGRNGWTQGNHCNGCYIHVDSTRVVDGTYHDTTIEPGFTSPVISANFTGTAVYVFNVVPGFVPNITTIISLIFFIDGVQVGTYTHSPVAQNPEILYHVPVLAHTGLENGAHLLEVRTSGSFNSLILFDNIIYTIEEDDNISSTSIPLPSQSTRFSTSSHTTAFMASLSSYEPFGLSSSTTSSQHSYALSVSSTITVTSLHTTHPSQKAGRSNKTSGAPLGIVIGGALGGGGALFLSILILSHYKAACVNSIRRMALCFHMRESQNRGSMTSTSVPSHRTSESSGIFSLAVSPTRQYCNESHPECFGPSESMETSRSSPPHAEAHRPDADVLGFGALSLYYLCNRVSNGHILQMTWLIFPTIRPLHHIIPAANQETLMLTPLHHTRPHILPEGMHTMSLVRAALQGCILMQLYRTRRSRRLLTTPHDRPSPELEEPATVTSLKKLSPIVCTPQWPTR
ncbi:hypothetical protein C8Q78DRAFT_1055983 [Trametes maxima]|nr:hypothetical protein C8Q78DRAFT_1055983 [Trametes maxima]